ncbi:MAG TPA: response regulator [Chloroflexi bacterium]|nr:response regulator [Chloroflexota bacterium]
MNKKILVVDDEPHIRVLLTYTLEDLKDQGVQIMLTKDGEQALKIALKERPDLILLDVGLPNRNGYEICQRIKAEHSDTYVILLTARGQTRDREQGVQVGADEYVTKPFDPDYIRRKAAKILGLTSSD